MIYDFFSSEVKMKVFFPLAEGVSFVNKYSGEEEKFILM